MKRFLISGILILGLTIILVFCYQQEIIHSNIS